MSDLTDAIAGLLAQAGVREADVLGSSYGGWVAQCLARRHPELVRHLVLVHTFALRASDAWRFRVGLALWRRIPRSLLRRLVSVRVRRVLHPARAASPAEHDRVAASLAAALRCDATYDALWRQNEHLLDSCRSLARAMPGVPGGQPSGRVLIIESDDDPVIRPRARARLRAMFPDAEVRTFHRTGHVTQVAAPEAFAAAVKSFLAAAP